MGGAPFFMNKIAEEEAAKEAGSEGKENENESEDKVEVKTVSA